MDLCRVTMGRTSLAPLTSCSLYGAWKGPAMALVEVEAVYMELCLLMMACLIPPTSTLSLMVEIWWVEGGLRSRAGGSLGSGPRRSILWNGAVEPAVLFLVCCSRDRDRWTPILSSVVRLYRYTQLGWGFGPGVFRLSPSSSE